MDIFFLILIALIIGIGAVIIMDMWETKADLRSIEFRMNEMERFREEANMFMGGRINMSVPPEKTPGMP